MGDALRDTMLRLWLKHGSQDARLPSPLYSGILVCDTKATKGEPSRSPWVGGQGTKEVGIGVSALNHFCCRRCRGRLDCQALQDMMGTR